MNIENLKALLDWKKIVAALVVLILGYLGLDNYVLNPEPEAEAPVEMAPEPEHVPVDRGGNPLEPEPEPVPAALKAFFECGADNTLVSCPVGETPDADTYGDCRAVGDGDTTLDDGDCS